MLKCLNAQKGIAIYLAIIIMVVLLSISLGISTLLIGQIKMIRGMGHSVVAIYAVDTGIERILFEIRKNGYSPLGPLPENPFGGTVIMANGATYTVEITDWPPNPTTIHSKGTYQGTHRAIEITY